MQLLAEFILLGSGYRGELFRFSQKITQIQSPELHQHCRTPHFVLTNFCWVIDSPLWHKSLVGCHWRAEEWNKNGSTGKQMQLKISFLDRSASRDTQTWNLYKFKCLASSQRSAWNKLKMTLEAFRMWSRCLQKTFLLYQSFIREDNAARAELLFTWEGGKPLEVFFSSC